jgi:5-methylcytosine-specific restriction endonuclease McrA
VEKYKRRPNVRCAMCGTFVYRRPAQLLSTGGHAYCTQMCYGLSLRKEHPCVICKKPILASANKKTCSRGCANINRTGLTYRTGARKDKVKYQRGLKLRLLSVRGTACERCGYKKYEILNVHHKDRNRSHNTLDNLELLCPNCHAEEHYLENNWFSGRIRDD